MSNIIDLKDVNIYQSKNLVLGEVNLTISEGEFVYLIGKTGAGKSSLLKTLYADLQLKEGEGQVADFDLKKISKKQIPHLRRKLGIVFQDFQLLTDRTVEKNLDFVLKATGWKNKKEMQDRINEVLEMVGLQTKNFKMPHELSGGEQQRVVIARALLNHPNLILADEPTGNLDPETSIEIMKLLQRICKESKTSILMATHDYSLMEIFESRTILLAENKATETKLSELEVTKTVKF